MFQRKLAEGTTMGGGTDDYCILDGGKDWPRHTAGILKMTPQLKGRIVILDVHSGNSVPPEGVVFSTRNDLVKTIESIHKKLGPRDLDA